MRVCLVLGAGASLANAMYFRRAKMRDTWPPLDTTFFETVDKRNIQISRNLADYFSKYIGIDPSPTALREFRMEEVFKDVSYDFRETPSDKTALNAYIDLVELYFRVLRETTNWLCADNRKGAPVGRLLATVAPTADDLTIVTFNHDLVIENEIMRRTNLKNRWCLDAGYGSISSSLSVVTPTTPLPMFQVHGDGGCNHTRPIRVLKLHGSLNWMMRINSARPTANFLKTGGSKASLQLIPMRTIHHRVSWVRAPGGGGRTEWQMWPVVVPPVYAKQELRGPALQQTWIDARQAIERADRVVFYGYSLPGLDVEAEKLFERALLKNRTAEWIDVINPASSSAARFASVSPKRPMRWSPSLDVFLRTPFP